VSGLSGPFGQLSTAAGLLLAALLVIATLTPVANAQSKSHVIGGDTPPPVEHGSARPHGHHDQNGLLTLNVGLDVRNSAELDALIAAASRPGSPRYGHYLTNAQYLSGYAPTGDEVRAAEAWLRGQDLQVTGSSPDNLLIHVRGRTVAVERAFGVTINDYQSGGRVFHSNDRNPTVPANLHVNFVSGLSNYDLYKPAITCTPNPGSKCAFDGGDFRSMYDISGDGKGRTLGFTLWGGELPQTDFDGYAAATGNTDITVGQAGDDGLNWIQVDGAGSNSTNTDNEIALDTEIAHGVAPGVHETYWLGKDNSSTTLEDVVNAAANSSISIISNSWGAQNNPCAVDGNEETSLQHGVSTGKTFYFSTGDSGASAGCSWPASSQYAVAVGGTTLAFGSTSDSAYTSETALNNGGGCLDAETRPSWQTGIGNAYVWGSSSPCSGRATPDVSANSGSGTYLYFDGSAGCCTGGTSLATPIWAAASVIWNKNNANSGRPGIGFAGPLIYSLANDSTDYANDFHDITSGSNGFSAGAGWDEATGWGSFDFNKLSNNLADIAYTGPTSANHGDTITLSATLTDHGTTNGLSGRTITFAAAGETCNGTTDSSGNASCPVTISDPPGHYKVIAVFAGDAGYKAASVTNDFTVLHIPTTITYTGATSGDYNDPVTLSATLTENSDNAGVQGESLAFTLGAESCSGTTDASGNASCTVTPLDNPGSYTVAVNFAGDEPTYEASSTSPSFILNQEESQVTYTGATTSHYHDSVTVSATLKDPDGGAPIAGKQITFTLGLGDTCSATTDASGDASCTIKPTQTGSQNVVASFAGDTDYVSNSATTAFSISPEETTMAYTGPTVILAGAAGATLTATMVEDGANDTDSDGDSPAPAPAESVTLGIGTQTCSGTTDASGNVSCTIPSVTAALGPQIVSAVFSGDAYYKASSDSTTAIVFAFPSRGAFTLGDKTVAAASSSTTVTWWADTWRSLNSLSGGSAPPADKGFANNVKLPTTTPALPGACTRNWTTSGGNSPPPTSGVPSYMGTLETGKVSKTGSGIDGNTVHIVVVKTNPGYSPDPTNHGTGTIVARFC
jgi:kumamolisin